MFKVFPDSPVPQQAKVCGAMQRMRKIDPVHLLWTIVLGFGASGERAFTQGNRT